MSTKATINHSSQLATYLLSTDNTFCSDWNNCWQLLSWRQGSVRNISDKFYELCDYHINKITFKRTRSLSNAMRFKRDNNVCACAMSALILLPIVTENGFSGIDFLYDVESLTVQRCFRLFARFFTAHDHSTIGLLPVKIRLHIWLHRTCFTRTLLRYVRVFVVANMSVVGAYSGGGSFQQYFFTAVYTGHLLTSV